MLKDWPDCEKPREKLLQHGPKSLSDAELLAIFLRTGVKGCHVVYPRIVVEAAIKHQAGAVILAHNHPSGIAEPSIADNQITSRLEQALALIDIKVLDHIIVAGCHCYSYAEHGRMVEQ